MKSDCRRYLTILTCMLGLSLLFETTATALEQWQPDTEYNAQWGLDMIDAGTAYGLGYTGSGVVVGIIDTGLDFTHPEFNAPGLFWGFNYPEESSPGILDADGHGSHVAGIIGARRDGTGMHGVAYNSSLVIAPMLSSSLGEAPFVDYLGGTIPILPYPIPRCRSSATVGDILIRTPKGIFASRTSPGRHWRFPNLKRRLTPFTGRWTAIS
jgi:hypothetical protein